MKIKYVFLTVLIILIKVHSYAATNRINLAGNDYFIFGANMGWLDGKYRCDFGYNEVWGWGPGYNPVNAETYLSDLKQMNVKVIRLWLFEAYDGLMFDNNGYVTNIDPDFFNNLDDFVKRCKNKNLFLFFCMISYPEWNDAGYSESTNWMYLNIVTNTTAQAYYIENAVKPLISRYKDSAAFFAVDIMNEPEFVIAGATGNWTAHGTTWGKMRTFLSNCVQGINSIDTNILVTCGSGWHEEDNVQAGRYSGLGLDFYSYHKYENAGSLVPYNTLGLDKPCIIGECGQSSGTWNDTVHNTAGSNFMYNAWTNGYAGVLLWQYSYPGDTTLWNLVNGDSSWRPLCYSMQEFAEKYWSVINIQLPSSGDNDDENNDESGDEEINTGLNNYCYRFSSNPVKRQDKMVIYFSCLESDSLQIFIYDLKGEKINTVVNNEFFQKNRAYEISWNCDDDAGKLLLPGLYIIKIKFGHYTPEFKTIGIIE